MGLLRGILSGLQLLFIDTVVFMVLLFPFLRFCFFAFLGLCLIFVTEL